MIAILNEYFVTLINWVQSAGWIGLLSYGLLFIIATSLFVPASLMAATAGFLFGPVFGSLLISCVGVLTAAIGFAIGSHAKHSWGLSPMKSRAGIRIIKEAMEKQAFRSVLLLRLSSVIPFAPMNYVLGGSKITFGRFVFASWLGMFPGTVVYVYIGSILPSVNQLLGDDNIALKSAHPTLFWTGFIVSVLVLALLARTATQALKRDAIDVEKLTNNVSSK